MYLRLLVTSACFSVVTAGFVPAIPFFQTERAHACGGAGQVTPAACPKVWVGREAEIEEWLRIAPIDRITDVPIGVTKPKRAFFAPGGPVASAAWKVLAPGYRQGHFESYKSEIAAYELDKLLGMHMVPPVVERRIGGDAGAVVLWVERVRSWKIDEPVRGPDEAWDRQVMRMKMFDNLICNTDRNQGNLLYDEEYHLILIDHSRAFTTSRKLPTALGRIDRTQWDRILGLTEPMLQTALGTWLGRKEIAAILERRALLVSEIARMVAARGERLVFAR